MGSRAAAEELGSPAPRANKLGLLNSFTAAFIFSLLSHSVPTVNMEPDCEPAPTFHYTDDARWGWPGGRDEHGEEAPIGDLFLDCVGLSVKEADGMSVMVPAYLREYGPDQCDDAGVTALMVSYVHVRMVTDRCGAAVCEQHWIL